MFSNHFTIICSQQSKADSIWLSLIPVILLGRQQNSGRYPTNWWKCKLFFSFLNEHYGVAISYNRLKYYCHYHTCQRCWLEHINTDKGPRYMHTVFHLIRTPGRYTKRQGGVFISYRISQFCRTWYIPRIIPNFPGPVLFPYAFQRTTTSARHLSMKWNDGFRYEIKLSTHF